MKTLLSLALTLGLACPLLAADYAPRNTQAPGENPPTPQESLAKITVPPGFNVSLFAAEPDVRQPVAMVTDDRGRIWVAESYSYKEWEKRGEDRVVILEDSDHDGVMDKRKVFWTGGNALSGMTVGWGGVWLCSAPHLLFIPDRNGDDVPDGKPEVVLDGWTTEAGHNFFNGLTWGIDGWLYGRHGITRPSTVGKPGTPDVERITFDCAIWRFHPVTKAFEVVSRGTTNPWGMDWNQEGELFFTNNVNGHLWHAIPGTLFPRMSNRPDPVIKYDYERLKMCADHLHHAGTIDDWTKTRDANGIHGDLGGGHSHCGGMIYYGDNWPEEYRGRIFMCNTHGRRLNENILERDGSGYVGRRAPDLFFANDPWFRGVTVLYGPDGGVFISDWSDFGECHDNEGVHRTSGRIYKVTYGKPENPGPVDLAKLDNDALVLFHLHDNEWYPRAARRLLQERAAAKKDVTAAANSLRDIFQDEKRSQVYRLRALWTLYAMGQTDEAFQISLLASPNEHVRKWGVRLLVDQGEPSEAARAKLLELAKHELSPIVRVYLASALQKLSYPDRWELATVLASDAAIQSDKNLPLMIWFGVKDAAAADPAKALAFMDGCKLDSSLRFTARVISETAATPENLAALLEKTRKLQQPLIAQGMVEGLAGNRELATPAGWQETREYLVSAKQETLAEELSLLLEREAALTALKERVEKSKDAAALQLLIQAQAPGTADLLLAALDQETLRPEALRGLAKISHPQAAAKILALYPQLQADLKPLAVETLVNSKGNAQALLTAMAAGSVPRAALTAYQARQIQAMKDSNLSKQLAQVWGELKSSSEEKKALIQSFQDQLTAHVLSQGSTGHGKELFTQRCASCHTLYGEGGKIGPDLTGANRADVYYLLENVIDPNATLPKDFHVTMVEKKDGQVVTGNIAGQTDYTLVLATPTGEITVNRDDIKTQTSVPVSIMPEGLLTGLPLADVRDLIHYLMKQ